ncbi:hypothetical protein NK6_8181 [Bradyrhizobium diazoefficiens]|uniref:Uncharacterized protein n=1 Tax=Bradyrhizobium diazoefficiens TaxID=1355477 RepID=A0A0E3VWQ7_9BRAD|nr:hypothetical protein NK6_8181 [Bradyrhizobium diazoefficiens]
MRQRNPHPAFVPGCCAVPPDDAPPRRAARAVDRCLVNGVEACRLTCLKVTTSIVIHRFVSTGG